jgi:hypothetical protein
MIARLTDGAIPAPRPMPAGRPEAVTRRPMSRESVAAVREPDPDVTAADAGPESTMAPSPSLAPVRDEPRRKEPEGGRTGRALNLAPAAIGTLPATTGTLPAATGTLPATTEPNAPDESEDAASIPQLPVRQRSRSTQSLPPSRPLDRPGPDIMRRVLSALHRL